MAESLQKGEQNDANYYKEYDGSQCPAWSLKTHGSA